MTYFIEIKGLRVRHVQQPGAQDAQAEGARQDVEALREGLHMSLLRLQLSREEGHRQPREGNSREEAGSAVPVVRI